MNIKQVLKHGIELLKENNIDEPILKTRILLASILNETKEYLVVHELEEVNEELVKIFKEDIEKVAKHIPIQYITNKQEFMGLEFYVDENVLIPQPDTEILVEETIKICVRGSAHSNSQKNIKILDLCTGSGAIGIAVAKNVLNCETTLVDISDNALKVAERNCKTILNKDNNKIKSIQSDLFENIGEKFDIIVSNPPYIKSDIIKTLDKEVQNEPILALDGGKDGLRHLQGNNKSST